jgi:glycolate oxidase iron-sulfur subunit
MSNDASFLKNLDYSVLQQCMHCGLCLPTCPTYDATKLERNSPRGRIALMRAIADERLQPSQAFAEEMYFCLGCLACMTACPAGVNYAELFENARAEAERSQVLASAKRSFLRRLTLHWLFTEHSRLQLVGRIIYLYQKLGLQALLRHSRLLRLFPKRLQELESMTPAVQKHFSDGLIELLTPAKGERRFRVALLTGCAQDLVFSDVNRDTLEVLVQNGCEVVTPRTQSCCGSLHAHNGELELAREMARRQIEAVPPEQFDAIITNAAGCGSHLKHYHALLKGDSRFEQRAKIWDEKVRDIHEWLASTGITRPRAEKQPELRVTYHEACHLCHGQKITSQPRTVLCAIPNLTLVELPESTWCCGSAGIYNLIQPEMANTLLKRKMTHIDSTRTEIVATGNPGCLLQIQNGARQTKQPLRVVHPVTLLAEAYRRE